MMNIETQTGSRNDKVIEIIHAAQTVISRYGYKKTTMDDIAQLLNITRSALYYYYKNKEEIFTAVIDYELDIFSDETSKLLEGKKTTLEKLTEFASGYMKLGERFRSLYKLGEEDIHNNYSYFKRIRNDIISSRTEIIREIFKHDNIIARHHDIDAVSVIFIKSMHGIKAFSPEDGVEEIRHNLVNFCIIFYTGLVCTAQKDISTNHVN